MAAPLAVVDEVLPLGLAVAALPAAPLRVPARAGCVGQFDLTLQTHAHLSPRHIAASHCASGRARARCRGARNIARARRSVVEMRAGGPARWPRSASCT